MTSSLMTQTQQPEISSFKVRFAPKFGSSCVSEAEYDFTSKVRAFLGDPQLYFMA